MQMKTKRQPRSSLTETLVEKISEQNGFNIDDPEFCLYEETDVEALETFLESTDGPLRTEILVFDTSVTILKSRDGEVTAEVEPMGEDF